jgi:hypothetical protein
MKLLKKEIEASNIGHPAVLRLMAKNDSREHKKRRR